ncbi:DUF2490 domain-containing protein [Polaribacter batillariae]|uniref:DUF2490 domain-containing protein n=1 Tax=Polaribacter batillariae TaxID=2808900 RepID=A0ABX7SVG9_9FLAO|nr:DUF2490 domain-containing protein [Polaribacter batillariae]QTD38244.1 DUF2490 domain-containing protein [Polaribacter batillariae]
MKKIFIIIVAIFSLSNVKCQTKSEKNFGSWYTIHVNHRFTNKWSFNTGVQERNYKLLENYNLALAYFGINYKINKKFTTNLSYMYVDIDRTFDPDVDPNTIEHRVFEQISYSTKHFKIPFSHRLRVEHRNLHTEKIHTLINRVRYRIKAKMPLNNSFYLNVSNESFINFKGNFYPENRFYSALGLKASKNVSLEVGYLGHYINNLHLDRLQLGIYIKTDYRKKAKN